ncbi:hypothetical protein BB561_003684 [Smittium simulii]|uniref:D-aminoacyl-tRNA deacylase n=1 Tax=Smittium simulii TaxID=133385 RepID=A0A2T9YK07_9FUNG|nr:hypothetical protein BB561_003684 [Smittium simulii]
MRAIVQRVKYAKNIVDNVTLQEISAGICVYVAFKKEDVDADIEYIVNKVLKLKLFDQNKVMWKQSVTSSNFEIICAPQQSILAESHLVESEDNSGYTCLYDAFITTLKKKYTADKIIALDYNKQNSIDLVNEGPVTILIDSRKFKYIDHSF